ncbi:MAG TPA: alpha/beta hydrolase domain-containing protein [bacterium]|nr:alpha/beta hydrolase domain-containing protein [bacterium]
MPIRARHAFCVVLLLQIGTAASGNAAVAPSQVSGVDVAATQSIGRFDNTPYIRTWGTLHGVVSPSERVVGLHALPKNATGQYEYASQFEIIAPATGGDTVIVEAENRGVPALLEMVSEFAASGSSPATVKYPSGFGNGFLFRHGIAYARVQWQTGIAAGIPASAQGVGEIVVRDFGRWLSNRFRTRIIGGISQSGWFVETFVAEGFNENPVDGTAVYAGAIAIDGTGNWLALNQFAQAHGTPQQPYLDPTDPQPISAATLLRRPKSDPFFVDVANYTDFYRLHASVTDTTKLPVGMRRYDWPSPHVAGGHETAPYAFRALHCNGGVPIPLNPISYSPYARALVLELAKRVGSRAASGVPALPPSTLFELGPAPTDTTHFNLLAGAVLGVPLVDADAQPKGGVRFPEVEDPVGKPTPVSLPPVVTTSISRVCGNFGGWQPMTAAELTQRYGSRDRYVRAYAAAVDRLIAAGYLLDSDRSMLLQRAAELYANPAGY